MHKYMKKSVKRVKSLPQASHYSPMLHRSWELPDGTLVTADTYDKTELDENDEVSSPSFRDYYQSKQKPPTMGAMSPNTGLTASVFAQQFLSKFHRLSTLQDEHPTEASPAMGAAGDAEKPADKAMVQEAMA